MPDLEHRSDYRARRAALREQNKTSRIIKRGIALTPVKFGISFNASHLNQAGALVNIYADGSVIVNHGGTEMGQGLFTKVAQVVAEELGIDIKRVRVSSTDTSKVPNVGGLLTSFTMRGLTAFRCRHKASTKRQKYTGTGTPSKVARSSTLLTVPRAHRSPSTR